MVKLQASILSLTLAASSALASSDEYQRRSLNNGLQSRAFKDDLFRRQPEPMHGVRFGYAMANRFHQAQDSADNVQSRGFEDDEELFGRDFDAGELFGRGYDLEAREPLSFSALGKMAKLASHARQAHHVQKAMRMGHHIAHTADQVGQVQDFASNFQNRGFEDDEDLFGRDLEAEELFGREYDLEVREPLSLSTVGKMAKLASHAREAHGDKAIKVGRHIVHTADRVGQVQDFVSNFQNRGFEDDEELFGRDFDAEELFGREYDLEAREPLSLSTVGKVAKLASDARAAHGDKAIKVGRHIVHTADRVGQVQDFVSNFQNRGFEDDEELFGRDLDAEELFGREYGLIDDLD
jgi:hypothetical protein